MKSPKQNTYDSYQRFEVSKIAVLDSGFRRTKKPFEAEVCHFQAIYLLLHYGAKAKRKEKSHINLFPSILVSKYTLFFPLLRYFGFQYSPHFPRLQMERYLYCCKLVAGLTKNSNGQTTIFGNLVRLKNADSWPGLTWSSNFVNHSLLQNEHYNCTHSSYHYQFYWCLSCECLSFLVEQPLLL